MKILNLGKISSIKRKTTINDYCGGSYSGKEAYHSGGIGVGGLRYVNGLDILDEEKTGDYLRANTETMRNGIGIYLREQSKNFLVLLRFDEIITIDFSKEYDKIKPRSGFSLFKYCMDKGIPYHYSKYMLMEDEILETHKPKLKIITSSLDEINFISTKINPAKIKNYFTNSPIAPKFIGTFENYEFSKV